MSFLKITKESIDAWSRLLEAEIEHGKENQLKIKRIMNLPLDGIQLLPHHRSIDDAFKEAIQTGTAINHVWVDKKDLCMMTEHVPCADIYRPAPIKVTSNPAGDWSMIVPRDLSVELARRSNIDYTGPLRTSHLVEYGVYENVRLIKTRADHSIQVQIDVWKDFTFDRYMNSKSQPQQRAGTLKLGVIAVRYAWGIQ